ncbi:MAG: dipeptidase [Alicyclobacillaceae bacterium]|nr:dipeptidase [Alicyclobacillaceae bacterium]
MVHIPVWDAHVDVLWRMARDGVSFDHPASPLAAGWENLRAGGVRVLGCSLFVSPNRPAGEGWQQLLQQLSVFYGRMVQSGDRVIPLLHREDLDDPAPQGDRVRALLSLEGCYALEGSLERLRRCMGLGVRVVSLTWNEANGLADGVGEPRGAGLTARGREFVREIGRLSGVVDVAHLAERGFWDVLEEARGPVMCSHANVRAVWPHRRNLTDGQLRALAEAGGVVGLTFVPAFIGPKGDLEELLLHVDHALRVAGTRHVAFGSDFDGSEEAVRGLETARRYPALAEALVQRYGPETARRLLWENWLQFFRGALPNRSDGAEAV